MNKTRIFILLCVLPALTGCAKLSHLPQLLTLKAYSENKDEQQDYVQKHDTNFEKLLKAVADNSLAQDKDKKSVLREFGDPILTQRLVRDNVTVDRLLYRYATKYFDSEKVYIYFDKKGKLLDWKHVVPKVTESEVGGASSVKEATPK